MMSFKNWSVAVGAATKESTVPNAVTTAGLPADTLERGWDNIADMLGMTGRPDYFYGRNAVGIGIAIMCADVKARDMSKSELLLYRRRPASRGYDLVAPGEHPMAEFFMDAPNQWHTWAELWRMIVLHVELTQNGYLLKQGFRRDGTFKALIPIQPARCRPMISPQGRLFYQIYSGTEYERAVLGDTVMIVPAEQMIHFRGRMSDGLHGMSSLTLGEPIFDIVSAIAAYQRNFFDNDGQPALAFETDADFGADDARSDAAFNRLKRQLTERWRKARTIGDPLLLEAGLKAKIIANTGKESETKDSFNQQVMRICGLMNTPPHKIFALESVAYNNASAMNRAYYNDALDPLATMIQEKLRSELFRKQDRLIYSPQFDQIKLMANDLEALTKLVDMSLKNAVMTFDEAREVLPFRFGVIANGGYRMVPVNYSLIDEKGEVIVNAASGQNPNQPGSDQQADPPADPVKDVPLRLVQ